MGRSYPFNVSFGKPKKDFLIDGEHLGISAKDQNHL
jgi:hypothetical protein